MFFTSKNTGAADGTAPGGEQLAKNYDAILTCLQGRELKYEEDREQNAAVVTLPTDGDEYRIRLRAERELLEATVETPFEIKGCTADEAALLCGYINSRVIAGSFYPDAGGARVVLRLVQRTPDGGAVTEKTAVYLLGTMCSLVDSKYMRSIAGLCRGYRSLDEVLGELAED